MLVVLGVNTRCDDGAVWATFVFVSDVDVQDTSETDLELDAAVLVEVVVPDIFWRRR